MRVLITLLFVAILQAPASAGEWGWRFSVRQSIHGPVCFASVQQHGVTLGFYGVPYGETFAFVKGVGLPGNARSTWQVAGHQWRQFTGVVDNYDGVHAYGIRPQFLREVALGNRLDVYLHDSHLAGNAPLTGTLGITLRGSSRAIEAMLDCQLG